eukprot:scaffold346_cov116-Cylindrotheca_fusiformis.AAC.29
MTKEERLGSTVVVFMSVPSGRNDEPNRASLINPQAIQFMHYSSRKRKQELLRETESIDRSVNK